MKNMHMMYLLMVVVFAIMVAAMPALAQLTEAFETGLPTTAPTTATNYTLSSGVWTILKGVRSTTKHGGTYALNLNNGTSTASYATAPALATVTTMTFWARGSGASTLTIQKSVNGGAYTTIASQRITSSYASYTITVNETGGNVRMRFQNSTSQTHYIDDVTINGGTPSPALAVTPTSLAFGSVTVNTTSQKTYALTGANLTPASGNITITAPSGYQVSTASGSGFASSITVAYTGSALAARTIYVNFTPTAVQSYNGNITNAGGGATTVNEAVTGSGIATASPTLTVSPTSLAYGSIVLNTTSQKTYTLSGSNLSPASGNITITAPTGYQVSTASGSGFASSITIAYTSGALSARTIYVNFTPTAAQAYNGNITNAGGGATTQNVAVTGTGVASLPATITVSPTSLSFGSVVINTTSAQQTYTLSAANLSPASGNITITAPTAFQVSATSGSGFASSITVAYTSGTLSARSIYARFTPTAVQSYSGNVTNAGGGATTQNVAVSGSGISTPPPPTSGMIGYATQNGGTTGGAAGPTVTVTNAADFENYVGSHDPYVVQVQGTIDLGTSQATVRENKTIIGLGTNATINGGLKISHYNNLIVRNLTIKNSNNDGITIQDCRNVWVDHCTFIDAADGQVDIVHASDWVTISWCKFYYTVNSGHDFVNLIGHDDSNSAEDTGTLHVTFHHNWWSTLCIDRMPSVRFGRVHVFDNYFNAPGNNYCIRTRINAEVLVENNYFENVKNPWERYVTSAGGTPGKLRAAGNIEVNTTWYVNPAPDGDGNQSFLIPGNDVVFTPPYAYTLESGSSVKASVMAGAGNTGIAKSAPELLHAQRNVPKSFSLKQNYPNPFNPTTEIRFTVATAGYASLKVYNTLGQEVANLFSGDVQTGQYYTVHFDARFLSSGMYFSVLESGMDRQIQKMVLMK